MKKALFLLLIVTASLSTKAQYVTLTDPDFAMWVKAQFPDCFLGFSFQLDTTCSDIVDLTTLYMQDNLDDIENLDGLQYFKSLETLVISGTVNGNPLANAISIIPALSSTLKRLSLSNTVIASLPQLPDALEIMELSENNLLTDISPLPAQLAKLQVSNTPITLPPLPNSLVHLYCVNMGGSLTFPLLPNGLRFLSSGGYNVTSFSQPRMPDSLRYLNFGSGTVANFPLLNDSLNTLSVSGNVMYQIPSFPPKLDSLRISTGSFVTYLPSFPTTLKYLFITSLNNLDCLPYLPSTLAKAYVASSLQCLPNQVPGIQVFNTQLNPINLPLCSPINNPNHCPSGPVISGTMFYDNNSNGVKDAGENFRSGISVSHTNGSIAYSNASGYFELSGSIGANNITVNAPPFYTVVPNASTYNFSSYDTLVTQSYALQPAVMADSVAFSVIPDVKARPGFSHRSLLVWENVGTTTVTPGITLRYNNAQLSFTSSVPAGATSNGNTITIPVAAILPGEIRTVSVQFAVSASAPLGDTIQFIGKAQAGSAIMMDSAYSIIRGSYDPNDKNATPVLSPQQVAEGTWINYLVRFQNTGNDTAINVVVTDTLDAQLDLSSLQVMGASHPAVTKRNGRNLSLEFYNIMLPDSNVNEPASHGYIRFRAKPLSSVVAGGIIPNYADIYFDYNSPVTTNTTTTTVRATVVPLSLLSFEASQDGEIATLRWSTASEINTRSFEIEQGSDGRTFNRVGIVAALGSGDHAYSFATPILHDISYFRLKMTDIDGRFSYSETRTLKKNKSEKAIYVVTNPARNMLTINCLNKIYVGSKAVMIDQSGRKVKTFTIQGGLQQVDIAAMEPGLYYLKTVGGVVDFVVSR